jgi:hypothetical protein
MTSPNLQFLFLLSKFTRFARALFSSKLLSKVQLSHYGEGGSPALSLKTTSMTDEANNNDADKKNANAKSRGPGYTAIEDLLICRAFIAASEDSLTGASQKAKTFKMTMHQKYKDLLVAQQALDKAAYSRSSSATRDVIGEPLIYHERTAESIYRRFKDTIAYTVLKFIGIEETTNVVSVSYLIAVFVSPIDFSVNLILFSNPSPQ